MTPPTDTTDMTDTPVEVGDVDAPETLTGDDAQPAATAPVERPSPSAADSLPARLGKRLRSAAQALVLPTIGIAIFLAVWAALAPQIDTSLGALPGPVEVASAGGDLIDEWQAQRDARAAFYSEQDARNAELVAAGRGAEVQAFEFTGAPTFVAQVWTSLRTVGLGFLIATLISVPIGIVSGLSRWVHTAINPLIQIMKPISPLAWLPIVTMVVSAAITSDDPVLPKSFIISAIVVALCSMWPTVINTDVGVSSIDQDLLNVGRVLRLTWFAKLRRLVLPAALPYIFTGMRLSLGVGWMVLIAAEMLSQNPGLGKFVWDEFQNGSPQSLSRIMFAVVVIGLIGCVLDRIMSGLQSTIGKRRGGR
jgi:nitrate/nitrite transport system permease protein